MAFNRSGRKRSNSPYTSSVLDKTISNLYNESISTSIGFELQGVEDTSGIVVALQNDRTNVSENIHADFQANPESPVRGVVQFDLKHPSSGMSANETLGQAILFLKLLDVSPKWPGYNLDICLMQPQGISIGLDATWNQSTINNVWNTTGIVPQIGVGYSLNQQEDKPFAVDGYYPLYLTKQGAIRKSPTPTQARTEEEKLKGWIGYHEHTLNGAVYYMPNGLRSTGNQYHGNYNTKSQSTARYGYNEYATEGEAKVRAIEMGCVGFHTIERNGMTIYKPCKTPIVAEPPEGTPIIQETTASSPVVFVETSNPDITETVGEGLIYLSGETPVTPQSSFPEIKEMSSQLKRGDEKISKEGSTEEPDAPVDARFDVFVSGGGTIAKDSKGNEVKISKLVPRTIRKDALLITDITPLVEEALARGERYLPLLIKGSHGTDRRTTESKSNASAGPQDQYIKFYSFDSPKDFTVFKGEFNTSRTDVTGTMTVDLYTSDANSNATGAYIMRPTAGTPTKRFNDFFSTAVSGDNVGIETGIVTVNNNTKIDLKNKSLTVEGYNKDYVQFQNNPIAGATPGTYTNVPIKLNRTVTVNELELISSSAGPVDLPFKAFEPFSVTYHGSSTGSNGTKTLTPTSIINRDGNVVVTVKETVVDEQHVDHTGGLQFVNLADSPRLKIYYRTRRI